MKNLIIVFISIFALQPFYSSSQNDAQKRRMYLRVAPSYGSTYLDEHRYEQTAIGASIHFSEGRSNWMWTLGIGKGEDKGGFFSSEDYSKINYFEAGMHRRIFSSKGHKKLSSTGYLGLSMISTKTESYSTNCDYIGAWFSSFGSLECNPQTERYNKIYMGIPFSYFLDFNFAQSIGMTLGVHASLYTDKFAHSGAVSLGINLGRL